MASIYKRKDRPYYMIGWRDEHGKKRSRSSGTTDKRAALRIKNDIEAKLALRREGVVDMRQEAMAEQGRRPLAEHVSDYVATKRDARRKECTVKDIERVLGWLLETTGAKVLDDLDANLISEALRQLRSDGMAPRTVNRYRSLVSTFLRWCVRMGRLSANPADVISALDEDGGEGRKRRALTVEEVQRLFEVAGERSRGLWYMAALWAGLRRSELIALKWGDIDFERATLTVEGGKARRVDVLPLHPELAEELAQAKPDLVHPTAKVFPTTVTNSTRQKDFARAGIELVDAEGRNADLHSLRGTLGTMLARQGVAPQVAMRLMRHSDYSTTLKHYTMLQIADSRGALEELGAIRSTGPSDQAERATGTDGGVLTDSGCDIEAPLDRQQIRQQSDARTVQFGASQCDDDVTPDEPDQSGELRLVELDPRQNPAPSQKEAGSVDPNADRAILSGLEREQEGGMAKWLRRRIANP